MSTSAIFHVISDSKFDFINIEIRNELRILLMKAGRKKVIFVEGYDDKIIFDIVYKDYLDRLHFIDTSMEEAKRNGSCRNVRGGCETVKELLKDFADHLPSEKHFYGVRGTQLCQHQGGKEPGSDSMVNVCESL